MSETRSGDSLSEYQPFLPDLADLIPDELFDTGRKVPGVLERIEHLVEAGIALDDPRAAMVLTAADAVSFGFWSEDQRLTEAAASLIRGQQSYERVLRDGFWNRARTWFGDFNRETTIPSAPNQRLPIAEIHIPHVSGCKGEFARTRSGAMEVTIKAFGIGASRTRMVALRSSIDAPASCRRLTIAVEYEIHVWKHRSKDVRRALVNMTALGRVVVDEALDPSHWHPCSRTTAAGAEKIVSMARIQGYELDVDYVRVPLAQSVATTPKLEMKIEEGTIYTTEYELPITAAAPFAAAPIPITTLSFSIVSKVTELIEFAWVLVPGHDYLSYRAVPADKRMFWVWV